MRTFDGRKERKNEKFGLFRCGVKNEENKYSAASSIFQIAVRYHICKRILGFVSKDGSQKSLKKKSEGI